jgi:sugar/nucleoside kinase (ribokinase family)
VEKKVEIIGIENLIMDFAVQIDKLPQTDGFARLEDFLWQSGGNVSSAIVAASRLGASCGMIGHCGDDPFGDFCYRDMQMHGVDVSHIKIVPDSTTTFCICLAEEATQGRSVIGKGGTASGIDIGPDLITEDYIGGAKYLHIGVWISEQVARAVELAHKHGVIVSMDGGGYNEDAEKILPKIDILIISEQFHDKMFNNTDYTGNCQKLVKNGSGIAMVTLGKKGCAGADKEGNTFELPSFSGHKIVDTTGAGDVFHGGFLYAHSQGWDTKTCARFASAVSYINCTSLGGRAGIPNRKVVDEFLKTGTIDRTEADKYQNYYRTSMFSQKKK